MDLFALEGPDRVPFAASAEVAERCKAAATEHGTIEGPSLELQAWVRDPETQAEVATWSFRSSTPSSRDLVYASTPQLDKYGIQPAPPRKNHPLQGVGMTLFGVGGLAAIEGAVLYAVAGGQWNRTSLTAGRIGLIGVPVAISGLVFLATGNKKIRKNPAPIPEDGSFWQPADAVLCAGEPTEVTDGATAAAPPSPAAEPGGGTSFVLAGPPEAQPASVPDLMGRAASSFLAHLVEAQP